MNGRARNFNDSMSAGKLRLASELSRLNTRHHLREQELFRNDPNVDTADA